jgi:hypothetical protein
MNQDRAVPGVRLRWEGEAMSEETARDADINAIVKPFESMWTEPGLSMRKRVVEELARLAKQARDERDAAEAKVRDLEAEVERHVSERQAIADITHEEITRLEAEREQAAPLKEALERIAQNGVDVTVTNGYAKALWRSQEMARAALATEQATDSARELRCVECGSADAGWLAEYPEMPAVCRRCGGSMKATDSACGEKP